MTPWLFTEPKSLEINKSQKQKNVVKFVVNKVVVISVFEFEITYYPCMFIMVGAH